MNLLRGFEGGAVVKTRTMWLMQVKLGCNLETKTQKDSHRKIANIKPSYKLKAVSVLEKGRDFNGPLGQAILGKPLDQAF